MDAHLFGDGNLLYHLTGMEYASMVAFMKAKIATPLITDLLLPSELVAQSAALAGLDVVKLGLEYWNNIDVFLQDCTLNLDELVHRLHDTTFGTKPWTPQQKITFMLWSNSFHHHLLAQTILDVFHRIGSVLTVHGDSMFVGLETLYDALDRFWQSRMPFTAFPIKGQESAVLQRKSISISLLFNKGAYPAHLDFLRPDNVSFGLL